MRNGPAAGFDRRCIGLIYCRLVLVRRDLMGVRRSCSEMVIRKSPQVVIFLDHVLSNTETRLKAAQSWNRPTQRDNFVIRIGHVEKDKSFDRGVVLKLDTGRLMQHPIGTLVEQCSPGKVAGSRQ
jgi:hypothetical protein